MMRSIAILALIAGCYRPTLGDCRVRCEQGGGCPAGLSCTDGLCHVPGAACAEALVDGAIGPGDGMQLDAFDPACVGVVCDEPPAATCVAGDVVRTYGAGTCIDGACSYPALDRACAGTCSGAACVGVWNTLGAGGPAARFSSTAVWTGSELIVWGGASSSTGSYGDGARLDAAGTWRALPSSGAPAARRDHTAVWTGTEMIVWGGASITQGAPFDTGARYIAATDRWAPLTATGAPRARFGHSAVWTGAEMIVWGGGTASTSSLADGAAYTPATNTWRPIASAPLAARRDHSAVWAAGRMIVWGGSTIYAGGGVFGDAAAYDPVADAWMPMTTVDPPAARFSHAAAWDGTGMLVWGGAASSTGTYGDGARLDPITGIWTDLPTVTTARREQAAVWTGRGFVLFGGSTIVDGGTVFAGAIQLQIYR